MYNWAGVGGRILKAYLRSKWKKKSYVQCNDVYGCWQFVWFSVACS